MAPAAQHGEGRLSPLTQEARPGTPGVLGNLLLTALEQVGGNFLGLSPTTKAKSTWTREPAEAIPNPPPPPSFPPPHHTRHTDGACCTGLAEREPPGAFWQRKPDGEALKNESPTGTLGLFPMSGCRYAGESRDA